jgi:transcriptional regulator with XRE-family HTH domain
VTTLIKKVTGAQYSHTTIWNLRNGQAANPRCASPRQLARTLGVPPAFVFSGYTGEHESGVAPDPGQGPGFGFKLAGDPPGAPDSWTNRHRFTGLLPI